MTLIPLRTMLGLTSLTAGLLLASCGGHEESAPAAAETTEQTAADDTVSGSSTGTPITPGKPITPGTPIQPGTPITPGKAIEPGIPITPGTPITIGETEDHVKLDIDSSLLFDYDDDQLKPEAKDILAEVTKALQPLGKASVEIHGHTDNQGGSEYNLALSERRAAAVLDYLKSQSGLGGITFSTYGHGDREPVASNGTEEGRRQNRRVEVIIDRQ